MISSRELKKRDFYLNKLIGFQDTEPVKVNTGIHRCKKSSSSKLMVKPLIGFRDRDRGHTIENVVYFELLRRGYDVAIGKISNAEVDFIATNANEKIYIQVTESMDNESVCERELALVMRIPDNYEKIVLSLHPRLDSSYEGIKSLHLIGYWEHNLLC